MLKLKNKLIVTIIIISLLTATIAYAHTDHSNCYSKILLYGGWGYTGSEVIIDYTYDDLGTKDYSYRLSLAIDEWEDCLSAFNFTEVSSNENCEIESDDFGDNGWVGIAYYYRSPKEIKINEWYHINYSNYGYTEYERTIIHEFGHLHGLGHTDCTEQIMSNHPDRDISQTDLGEGDEAGIADIY